MNDFTYPIYKINRLNDKNVVSSIYVFYGDRHENETDEIIIDKTFNNEELQQNEINNTEIIILPYKIHYDDTIGVIKLKLVKGLENNISFNEIYLFCQQYNTINVINIYNALTKQKNIQLTNVKVEQYINNINLQLNNKIQLQQKEVYSINDLLALKINNNEYLVDIILGQKKSIINNEYPYIANPFKVNFLDNYYEQYKRRSISSLNKKAAAH